ncbi:integrator complex subunit 9 homolog isoform X2 [Tripterygium wilfordii]|uniref:integrator complex subunit 9 homolog isoform X2 n=1 Tax=Tripterygium wilfordii TaxID=458696 RepID=UPI0018F81C1D|nr:integrator complex subunit 9 homolog isoform X2 [Tripterygium wilfordii]
MQSLGTKQLVICTFGTPHSLILYSYQAQWVCLGCHFLLETKVFPQRYFYGPEASNYPQWMKWEELELLPSALKDIALGKDGTELGGWIPLYSAADVKDCVQKLQTLKYAEEACYNGTLVIKAFSSGSDVGACNWTISGPKGNVAYVSSSTFVSAHAMDFDYQALQGKHVIIYSDFSFQDVNDDPGHDNDSSDSTTNILSTPSNDEDNWKELTKSLLSNEENIEEKEKLAFICSCMIDSVKARGSVLIPTTRLGLILQLLEEISVLLESSNLTVPIYFISSIAEDLFAFTNIIPEWLSKQRQEKLFSGDPLFAHSDLIKAKKLLMFPAIHSQKLLTNWEEPCIVFAPHWSLRIGPAVHLLRRWCRDENSLLVLEEAVDANVALLPFKPTTMKVLQCSFPSGIKLPKVKPLLTALQPKVVLFPEAMRHHISFANSSPFSIIRYSENETLPIPGCKDNLEIEIAADLVSKLQWRKTKQTSLNLVRLKGELFMDHGKYRLSSGKELLMDDSAESRPLLHWGSPDLQRLLDALSELGISGSVEQVTSDNESETKAIVHINDPDRASIEVRATSTVITAASENLASLIFEATDRVLDSI